MPASKTRKGNGSKPRTQRVTTRPTTGHAPDDLGPQDHRRAPAEGKYAPSTWGSNQVYTDLVFPSGQLALVRRPGLQGLLKEGILHNLDTLTPFIEDHKAAANGRPAKAKKLTTKDIVSNPKLMDDMLHTVDRILCGCVVQPPIHMTPNDVTLRQDGVIYADMVDLDDKMFLFQFVVGGTADLERFREESTAAMGSLRDGEEDGGDAV